MLYMGIGKYILVVAVKNPSEDLPVYVILSVDLGVLLVDAEQFDHVKSSFGFV